MMPAIFFGHGNPMHAITRNPWGDRWSEIGKSVRKPKAILSISAHWFVENSAVTISTNPRTIHDFGGFPRALYEVSYPAPGDPQLADRVRDLLAGFVEVARDDAWGLDHGTWSVLLHAFPAADIPVVQLAIDEAQPPRVHFEIGKRLAPLRNEDVLVIGSGNVVHNLHTFAWGRHTPEPFDWALRFEQLVRDSIGGNDPDPLVNYEQLGSDAMLAVPTPDHYLPLLYILGMRQSDDLAAFPVAGVDGGSISMLAVDLRPATECA